MKEQTGWILGNAFNNNNNNNKTIDLLARTDTQYFSSFFFFCSPAVRNLFFIIFLILPLEKSSLICRVRASGQARARANLYCLLNSFFWFSRMASLALIRILLYIVMLIVFLLSRHSLWIIPRVSHQIRRSTFLFYSVRHASETWDPNADFSGAGHPLLRLVLL